jgi:tetratricopeptide (TPR) repeat protein
MDKLIFYFFSVFFMVPHFLKAQDEPIFDSKMVEDSTYRFYLDGDWWSVISYGEAALKENIDYYYLRMRLGIAYYKLGRFRMAIPHFEKANEMNQLEEGAKEYLYWCYIYSDRFEDAGKLSKTFSAETAKSAGTEKQKSIAFFLLESGTKIADKSSLFDPLWYMQGGTGHMLKKQIYFFQSATFLSQNTYWGSYKQLEYYAKVNMPIAKSWCLAPAFHITNLNASPYSNSTYFLGSLNATKQLKLFQPHLNASWSNLFGTSQIQTGTGLKYYPFGNNNLCIAVSANVLVPSTGNAAFHFQHNVSYAPNIKWTFSGWFYHGNAYLFNENNGYLVNSSYDLLRNRSSLMATYSLHRHLDIYTLIQNEQKTEYFNGNNYQFNNFILGIKYIP